MDARQEENQYKDKFKAQVFLNQRFKKPGTPLNQFRDMRLKMIHELFSSKTMHSNAKDLKVLDYGSGPVLAFIISAASKENVSEIVLAEYTTTNREALHQWLYKDSSAFNWLPYIKYVVQHLETKPESEVLVREERLRNLVKVASCDVKAEQPIEKGFEGPYDVVMTSLAIGSACHSEIDYTTSIQKLSTLVKTGGVLYMFSKVAQKSQPMHYELGGEKFYYYAISTDILIRSLEEMGFENVQCVRIPIADTISGLSQSEAAQLEIHTSSEEFCYVSVVAVKT